MPCRRCRSLCVMFMPERRGQSPFQRQYTVSASCDYNGSCSHIFQTRTLCARERRFTSIRLLHTRRREPRQVMLRKILNLLSGIIFHCTTNTGTLCISRCVLPFDILLCP